MLEPAYLRRDEVKGLYAENIGKPVNKWFRNGSYVVFELKIDPDQWIRYQYVSVDKNNNIVGYLRANNSREHKLVDTIAIINFNGDKSLEFGKDVKRFFWLLLQSDTRKIKFSVVIGNPIEATYDKICKKFGGRIVGTFYKDVKLLDGTYADRKCYEIMKDNKLMKSILSEKRYGKLLEPVRELI